MLADCEFLVCVCVSVGLLNLEWFGRTESKRIAPLCVFLDLK